MRTTYSFVGALALSLVLVGAGCQLLEGNSRMMEGDTMMQNETRVEGEMMMENDGPKKSDEGVMMENEMNNKMENKNEGAMMDKGDAMMKSGSYEVYDAAKLARAKEGKVVLFFKAGWCPSCKTVDADINAHLSAIPAGTSILVVNYDTAAELKKKYGVTYQHTFVQVDENGEMIKKWSGSPTLAELSAQIQ